jgi:DNA-binding XRE family transcriptional regulator
MSRTAELLLLEQAAEKIQNIVKSLRRMDLVPMSYILARVPGETVVEKSAAIGVSRQTYYYWLHGRSRPSQPQAEKLAELTGIPVGDIMTVEEEVV